MLADTGKTAHQHIECKKTSKANGSSVERHTSMSENNAMTEGAASEEATTVKNETCKKCNGSGYYTVYTAALGLPVDVECCPQWDDYDDEDPDERDRREDELQEAFEEYYADFEEYYADFGWCYAAFGWCPCCN